jgi:glycosyltransferase involved in cell wall biosynthesis
VLSANLIKPSGVHRGTMTHKKIKILTLSDHPLSPSGVGTQTKYFISEMLQTGKFQFISLGGAIKHENYNPMKVDGFDDDWVIYPVDGYGNPDTIRSILRNYKPDMIWFMTDPRFYPWLWEMENEVRSLCPLIYYHVWDNFPYPTFNKIWYDSTDVVVSISKLTSNLVQTVSPDVEEHYLPHAIPTDIFAKIDETTVRKFKKENLDIDASSDDHFLIFWNSRNARRKQSGSLIFWFDSFVKKLTKKHKNAKATLLMHTEPKDPNGQDLYRIIQELNLDGNFETKQGRVKISNDKLDLPVLSMLYNAADVTMGVSDAEGFGLSTFESLACETPIIVTMTGGLQEQVTFVDEVSHDSTLKRNKKAKPVTEYEHGIGLEPASKAIIGSQEVPFIYEDRISEKQVVDALMKMYEYGKDRRNELGAAGREHVMKNYNFKDFAKKWEEILVDAHENYGSWDNRKNYKSWELRVV